MKNSTFVGLCNDSSLTFCGIPDNRKWQQLNPGLLRHFWDVPVTWLLPKPLVLETFWNAEWECLSQGAVSQWDEILLWSLLQRACLPGSVVRSWVGNGSYRLHSFKCMMFTWIGHLWCKLSCMITVVCQCSCGLLDTHYLKIPEHTFVGIASLFHLYSNETGYWLSNKVIFTRKCSLKSPSNGLVESLIFKRYV